MSNDYIKVYLNQHCRFVLRSGKEVFGVVWKASSQDEDTYYFSSVSEHKSFSETHDLCVAPNKLLVKVDDILLAERIVA